VRRSEEKTGSRKDAKAQRKKLDRMNWIDKIQGRKELSHTEAQSTQRKIFFVLRK